jgi:hypothetical protein
MEIRLLDGEVREQEYLLSNMADDHFYYVELGTDRCLSYSSAKQLIESPKWFDHKRRKPDPETQALRDGRLVHAAILEPQKYDSFTFVDTSTKNTKKWKLAVDQNGKANTFTMKEKYMNDRVVSAFLQNATMTSFLEGSETEVPAIEMIDGIPFRGKADILNREKGFIADVKTMTGKVQDFAEMVDAYDYDLQAYLYTQLFEVEEFVFLVISKTTTDLLEAKVTDSMLERGKAKLDYAIDVYKRVFINEEIDLSQITHQIELT